MKRTGWRDGWLLALGCASALAVGGACRAEEVDPAIEEDRAALRDLRAEYEQALKARLADVDQRLGELRAEAGEGVTRLVRELDAERDELSTRTHDIADQRDELWDGFKADVERGFDRIEAALTEASR